MSESSLFLWGIQLSYLCVYLAMDYGKKSWIHKLSVINLLKCSGPRNGAEWLYIAAKCKA